MFKRILTYSILSLIALGGFFSNVNIDILSINNISEITVEFNGNNTYAASGDVVSTASVTMYNNLIDNINIALAVLSTMVSPIILFVGWLMSPDWTSGDLFGLRAPMYNLWVTVSNIVYFIYAILLIIIALGTMFGHGTFSYKVMLPKLALGIIMVPFTWWFVQWTISISSVVTATVMTIPADTIGTNDSIWFTKPSIPTIIVVDNTGTGTESLKSDCSQAAVSGPGCLSPKDFIKNAGGMYSPLIIYGYSIFKFEKIKHLEGPLDIASAALQIVHTSIISTIMFAVFGLLTLALAAMLLMRAMKLWMYAIFAPLFTFRFVAGSNLLGGKDDSFSIKEFIGLAFVPAIVGLTLSFGLIIINAVQGPANSGPAASTSCNLESEEGCTILNIMGGDKNKITRKITQDVNNPNVKITSTTFAFGGVEFYFLGKATNQTNTTTNAAGAIDALGGMFGTLIIDVIALVFIWMSFMAAKKVSNAVEAAFEPFEKIGSQVGNLAKSLPKYTPLPIPGGSVSGLKHAADLSQQKFESHMREKEEANIGKFAPGLVQGLIKEQDRLKAKNELEKKPTDYNHIQSTLGTLATGAKSTQSNIESMQKAMKEGHVNREEFSKNIARDRSMSDELRTAATKFAQEKQLDTKETELVMKWIQSKGGVNSGVNSNTSGITGAFTDSAQKNYNIKIGNEIIKYDFATKKASITDEDRVELKKFTKKEFEKALDANLSDIQKNEIMKALEKEVFAPEVKS